MRNHGYIFNVALALDRFISAVFGGHHLETISGRIGRAEAKGSKIAWVCARVLDLFEKDHCAICYRWERLMMHKISQLDRDSPSSDS